MEHPCPHCGEPVSGKALSQQPMFEPHRWCPACGEHITHDPDTKRRQFVALFMALDTLALTILAIALRGWWWLGAIALYVLLIGWILWAYRLVRFVPVDT